MWPNTGFPEWKQNPSKSFSCLLSLLEVCTVFPVTTWSLGTFSPARGTPPRHCAGNCWGGDDSLSFDRIVQNYWNSSWVGTRPGFLSLEQSVLLTANGLVNQNRPSFWGEEEFWSSRTVQVYSNLAIGSRNQNSMCLTISPARAWMFLGKRIRRCLLAEFPWGFGSRLSIPVLPVPWCTGRAWFRECQGHV